MRKKEEEETEKKTANREAREKGKKVT